MLKISTDKSEKFYAHGKLMLTSEYFVLDGARSLAIPTCFGQQMKVKELSSNNQLLFWIAKNYEKNIWLNLVFETAHFSCLNSNEKQAEILSKLFKEIRNQQPDFLKNDNDIAIETQLEFPNIWGLGSSSTLIYNLATWSKADPFLLLQKTIGGSGYDVACAANDTPILYQLKNNIPEVNPVPFYPPFADSLYFVYTGQKQLSSSGIQHYKSLKLDKEAIIKTLNNLTEKMIQCDSLHKFKTLVELHEAIISEHLNMAKAKEVLFADLDCSAKWLGAWGGDFSLVIYEGEKSELANYLYSKERNNFFTFDEMIF